MTQLSLTTLLIIFGLISGCSDSGKRKSGSSSSNVNAVNCAQFPFANECLNNPTTGSSGGGTTGTTGGGSTSGSGNPGNFQFISDNNWQALYPDGEPQGSCSAPTGSGYDTRKGTVTMSGGQTYTPNKSWTSVGEPEYTSIRYSHNVSSYFSSQTDSMAFYDTDSKLKVRFRPRPQPKAPTGKTWCYGRTTGTSALAYGYTSVVFDVGVRRVVNGVREGFYFRTFNGQTATVNNCSNTIDLSGVNQGTDGIFLEIFNVRAQGCWAGSGCTAMEPVKTGSCWMLDIEVAADGTKDI